MLTCPFCGTDYGDRGLKEGRCRVCGGVVAWDSGDDVTLEQVRRVAEQTATLLAPAGGFGLTARTNPTRDRASSADRDEPLDVFPVPPSRAPAPPSPSPPAASPAPQRTVDPARVSALWLDSAKPTASPRMTLKATAAEEMSALHLDLQPRSLRRPGEAAAAKVDYELQDVIGEGGIGIVYASRQTSVDRLVAVKMIRAERLTDGDVREKFLAEAVVTGDLDHPNIVPIYDLGRTPDGHVFYSMKRVQGTPWSEKLPRATLDENLEILSNVVDAVAFAHARGVLHRDLKPENVMLGDFGEVLVMDWGLALPLPAFGKTTCPNRSLGGTPAYMAPEMVTGPISAIGPASDVYLLGAILYEIVSGFPPHAGSDVMQCLLAAAENRIVPTIADGELLEIATRALATNPEDRFADVPQFQAALDDYRSHSESVVMTDRAEQELAEARQSGDYEHYSRALFGFQEAYALWEKNDEAREGVSVAKLAYAERAFDKGDFDLGLSLLDSQDPRHEALRTRLKTGQTERDARQARLKNVRRLVVMLVALLLVGGTCGMILIEQQRRGAVDARREADEKRRIAEDAMREAEEQSAAALKARAEEAAQRRRAEEEKQAAERERQLANVARAAAEEQRERAAFEQQRAEQQSYLAEIGLAEEKIAGNAFEVARKTLFDQRESPAKSKMRHWEWGRFVYLCQGGATFAGETPAVTSFAAEMPVEALALSPSGEFIALGGSEGRVELWRLPRGDEPGRRERQFALGQSVGGVAFDRTETWLAAAGAESGRAVVKVWRLDGDAKSPPQTFAAPGAMVNGVDFSPDGRWLVTAGDDKTVRLWDWHTSPKRERGTDQPSLALRTSEADKNERTLLGHLDAVRQVAFSPDGTRIVSASLDGTARIWSVADGTELKRFRGHGAAVLAARFAPDGRHVASCGDDHRVLLWDAESAALKATFAGHKSNVQSLGFSPDGRLIVSAANDNTLAVWDVDPRDPQPGEFIAALRQRATALGLPERQLAVLRGHGGWVRGCRFLPDGRAVVSAGFDGSWKQWDLAAYAEIRVLGGELPVLAAAYAPSGDRVVTAHDDGTVHLWDARRGRGLGAFEEGHEFLTSGAAFFPDGTRLATAGGDNTVRLWDVRRGTEQFVLTSTGRRGLVDVSRDGRFVLTAADDKTARLWDAETGRLRHTLDPHADDWRKFQASRPTASRAVFQRRLPELTALAFSHDGALVFLGDGTGRCSLWQAETGQLVRPCRGHDESVLAALFQPPGGSTGEFGPLLFTASGDGTVAQWQVASGQERPQSRLRHPDVVTLLAVAPDGDRLLTTSAVPDPTGRSEKRKVRLALWNVRSAESERQHDFEAATIQSLAFLPDRPGEPANSGLIVTTNVETSQQSYWRWSLSDGGLTPYLPGHRSLGATWTVVPSPNGRELLTVGGKGARLWEANSGEPVMSFRPHGKVFAVAFSPDGTRLATAGSDGTAKLWDAASHKGQHKLTGTHRGPVNGLAWTPDGARLLTVGDDGTAVLWDAAKGEPLGDAPFVRHTAALFQAAFSPDGRTLATVGADGHAVLWDVPTRAPRHTLPGHTLAVTCVTFSPDGAWLLTGGEDKTGRIWSAVTGRLTAVLTGHSAAVASVAFARDRLRVLTGSHDSTAKLWDTRFLARRPASVAPAAAVPVVAAQEIVSFRRHERELTTVAFAPDGRDVLTAGRDGRAVVWLGDYVEPSMELAGSGLSFRVGSPPLPIDPLATLCCPAAANFDGATLTVSLDEPTAGRLGLQHQGDAPGQLAVRGADLFHRSPRDAESRRIARWSAEAGRLQVRFDAAADSSAIESVLRNVTFVTDQSTVGVTWHVKFALLDKQGRHGNAVEEEQSIRLIAP